MAPYRTAAMIFTTILDLKARRKAKEASLHRAIKSLVSSNHHVSANLFNHAQGGCLKCVIEQNGGQVVV